MTNADLAAKLAAFIARKAELEALGLDSLAAAYGKSIAKLEATLKAAA